MIKLLFRFLRSPLKIALWTAALCFVIFINQSCVSKKMYSFSVQKVDQLSKENQTLIKENQLLNDSLTSAIAFYGSALNDLRSKADKSEFEVNNLRKEIAVTEAKIQEKSALVKTLQQGYSAQVNKLQEAYAKQQVLEDFLQVQTQQWKKLEEPIMEVFKGIPDSSVSVTHTDGRLMISLKNKLLFPSGSTALNVEGQEKITALAKTLSKYPDLSLTVEGHTDNVPVLPNQPFKDNLDLSFLRAKVVSNIMKSSISPNKLIVAGRGEFNPIASNETEEGKAENRRTEIIVTRENHDFDALVNQIMLAPPPIPTHAKVITVPDAIEKYFIDEKSWTDFRFSSYQGKQLVELIRLLDRSSNWKINTGNNPFPTFVRRHRAVVVYSISSPLIQQITLDKDDTRNELTILSTN